MMSNFPARARSSRPAGWWCPPQALMIATAVAAATAIAGPAAADDTPAPAAPAAAAAAADMPRGAPAMAQRVRISEVSVQAVAPGDPAISNTVHPSAMATLNNPVMISVQVAEPFTDLERSSSPVIVVDGRTLGDSYVPFNERNKVVAIMPDTAGLQATVSVQVGWLGDFPRTLSEPVQAHVSR